MKKFTSGANGHMFSLFRLRERGEENREQSLRKERLHLFFLHAAALAPREFFDYMAERLQACKLESREESARKKRSSEKFH